MIVVDASLAVKWLVLESDSQAAYTFLQRHLGALAAPDLMLNEVGGAIVRRANMGELTPLQATNMLGAWTDFWHEDTIQAYRLSMELVNIAASIAMALGHPLADCIYLALAVELDADIATCDAKFHGRAARHFAQVKLLGEFDLA